MALERSAIIGHLTRLGWTLTRTDSDHSEIWQPPAGPTIRIEPVQGWTDDDARTAARRVSAIDGTPWHEVLGVPAPFDPKSDPVLHVNGREAEHAAAFRDADEARQIRHLKREHSIAPESAVTISGADPLPEAHEWLHYKFDRD
jgi:hypothetical protein